MKPSLLPIQPSCRQGMSKLSLIVGLVLWVAVFASLIWTYNRRQAPEESGSVVGQAQTTEDGAPVIIDKSDPDQASKSTVVRGFPARPLPEFDFENSEGGRFGTTDLKGKRWVASFVFSRCRSTCPLITGAMMKVHDDVKGKADEVIFVTITVDPAYDTAEVFQEYAENFRQGDSSRWKFLTGGQQEIYELIVKGFGLYVAENLGEDRKAGFEVAHTNRVVLVNEDTVPVATFLGTREEDMIKLRRILTGKAEFPEAGPTLTFGTPNGQPLGLTFEMVEVDDEEQDGKEKEDGAKQDSSSGNEESEGSDVAKESPKGESTESQPEQSESSGENGESDSATSQPKTDGQQPLSVRQPPRNYLLTSHLSTQEETAEEDSADNTSPTEDDEQETNSDRPKPVKDADSDELSVAEFNAALQEKLPTWAARLPAVNAGLNAIATLLLLVGYLAIRSKKKSLHRNLMISAFLMSVLFLLSYLTYHYALGKYTGEHGRRFEGTGIWATLYPWILWPHVVLAVFVPILAIKVFSLAFQQRWEEHRRIARITFPIWLYVSVTGVIIYAMLYHWPSQNAAEVGRLRQQATIFQLSSDLGPDSRLEFVPNTEA